ncbi:retinal-specific phospholipid-transporting ATPase ABCA4-like [Ornithodoros turicata]|uniref:retinal-specific phospholipid-transporting ATPase ABCA4-like n=1 Tax=Ornithodoros turicata TaxID=34597 RepID=UPI00313A3B25
MGAYSQLKLVLWKNITLRLRQPVLLCLELFWPITIFLLVLALRKVVPPTTQEACYYNARALPSAGALPVLQSLICNVDNDCLNRSSFEDIPSYPGSKITKLVDNLSPLVHDQQILNVVKALPVLAKVLQPIQAVLNDENIVKLLEHGFPLHEVLRNTSEAQDVLVRHARMSSGDSEAFLMSDLNVPAILNELQHGGISKQSLPCNEKTLRKFIILKTIPSPSM